MCPNLMPVDVRRDRQASGQLCVTCGVEPSARAGHGCRQGPDGHPPQTYLDTGSAVTSPMSY